MRFWRCENERAQAQAVAAELETLIAGGVDPGETAILVRSARNEAATVAAALEDRSIPFRITGAGAFFDRAEVRDLLAWLRLLSDPNDASAIVRVLTRSPIELSPVDLARSTQIARRRKTDMVSALEVVRETEGTPPDACERIDGFLRLYRRAAGAFDELPPDLFLNRLIDRLGLRKQQLFVARPPIPRAARQHRQVRGAGGRLGTAQAPRHDTRVRALRRRRRRGGDARGGGELAGGVRRRAAHDDARCEGARVRPRVRAGAEPEPHARLTALAPRSRSRTTFSRKRFLRTRGRRTSMRCAGSSMWR